ncbi:hypothetical protein KBC59_03575 [Patescibacteria group bacterium]|nr:hypothetical protein [Patescibacteria group bacterium]
MINKTSAFSLIVSAVLLACSSSPTEKKSEDGNLIENTGGGGGGADVGSSGQGGDSAETPVQRAAAGYCDALCECFECDAEDREDCIREFNDSTEEGEACDALLVQQLGCAAASIDGCPADYDKELEMINCAPPMEEQEAVCGPGGIPG